jgi:SAM-dependent methyltransferase
MEFKQGLSEELDKVVQEGSMDLIIANASFSLATDKQRVLEGMFKCLKPGGEACVCDIFCDRRLPNEVKSNKDLWEQCLGGADFYIDFQLQAKQAGFFGCRRVDYSEIPVPSDVRDKVGNARFLAIAYRLFKVEDGIAMDACEDYGHVATYLGTLQGEDKTVFALDDHHVFEANRPDLVCARTAGMLSMTWLKKHFKVEGNFDRHFGLFDHDRTIKPSALLIMTTSSGSDDQGEDKSKQFKEKGC